MQSLQIALATPDFWFKIGGVLLAAIVAVGRFFYQPTTGKPNPLAAPHRSSIQCSLLILAIIAFSVVYAKDHPEAPIHRGDVYTYCILAICGISFLRDKI